MPRDLLAAASGGPFSLPPHAAVAAASVVRSTLATVGISLAVLLLLPIAGTVRPVETWLPTTLATAPADLLTRAHPPSHYIPALAVAVAAGAAALTVAVRSGGR